MRKIVLVALIATVLPEPILLAQLVPERIQRHFVGDDYVVTWGTPAKYESEARLEVGDGYGHPGVLRWLRFEPGQRRVDVLCLELNERVSPYNSKWPPDRAAVSVQKAVMKREVYSALLRDLGIVGATEVKPIQRRGFPLKYWIDSQDLWAYARVTAKNNTVLRLDWAGHPSALSAADTAKPQAAVALTQEAIEGLDFRDHTLTKQERTWASAKFTRDWRQFRGRDSHWWVREAYIQMIGLVGDKMALPVLRRILEGPEQDGLGDESDDRCTYHAINAVSRLAKKDLRDKPVEEMNVENTRRRVLEFLGGGLENKTSPHSKGTPNQRMNESGG